MVEPLWRLSAYSVSDILHILSFTVLWLRCTGCSHCSTRASSSIFNTLLWFHTLRRVKSYMVPIALNFSRTYIRAYCAWADAENLCHFWFLSENFQFLICMETTRVPIQWSIQPIYGSCNSNCFQLFLEHPLSINVCDMWWPFVSGIYYFLLFQPQRCA